MGSTSFGDSEMDQLRMVYWNARKWLSIPQKDMQEHSIPEH